MCLDCVWNVIGRSLEVVLKMSAWCLEDVWMVSGRCREGVGKWSGSCPRGVFELSEGVGMVSGRCWEGAEILFKPFFWTSIMAYKCL